MVQHLPNVDEIEFVGETYPLSPIRTLAARACSLGFVAAVAVGAFGQHLPLNLPPEVMDFVEQRKSFVIGGGFALNILGGKLSQSGAFEIYIDGKLMWSKLETGQVPEVHAIEKLVLEKTLLEKYEA